MKTLKALIATAIIGSSSLALAQPVYRYDNRDEYSQQQRFRERRGPVMLAQDLQLDRRNPAFVSLDGRVRQLRFDADDGRVFIDSIVMTFANGQSRTLTVRQRLSERSEPLTINVDARATGIYIYGMSRRGSLDVVGIRNDFSRFSRWSDARSRY